MKHMYSSIFTVALFTLSAFNAYAQGPNDSGTYYQAADGKKGAELKTALCAIIYSRTERTYKQLWTDFQTTDKKENGKVWDMYSNLREMTFVTDQAGNYKKEGDVYNREHSWPNSWFGGEVQPMYTDLHHLYPTDGFVNNKRSNYAFGETNGESYKSANDFSKLGACTYPGYTGTVFEPNDDYKGDFARTYFYMVTCYEEKLPDWFTNYGTKEGVSQTIDGSKYPGLRDWQLEMLMKWTKNDPVSADKETPRNNAVYTIQNNRNPFIDYPGLEEYIWGSMKDVAFSYDHYQMPTAIITTQAERSTKDGVMYNLAGQVVDKSYKGIVIMNGKKFMNK
jgi:endonuclease I